MARILKRALQAAVPSDTLFVMATKISRRALKLSMTDEQPWMRYVHDVVEAAQAEITSR
jgi:DNA-directed RNA polymerase subunit K/omega